eukprot:1183001-Prorocentrum_minimum.AAC.7
MPAHQKYASSTRCRNRGSELSKTTCTACDPAASRIVGTTGNHAGIASKTSTLALEVICSMSLPSESSNVRQRTTLLEVSSVESLMASSPVPVKSVPTTSMLKVRGESASG